MPPQLDAESARDGIAQPFTVVHPDARFAGASSVGLADLQRAEQAEFQAQPVTLGELADGGHAPDVFVHVGHQAPGRVLSGPVLAEEVIEGQREGVGAPRLSAEAHLAKALHARLAAQRQVQDRVRIRKSFQLLVTHQDDGGVGQQERPGARPGYQF